MSRRPHRNKVPCANCPRVDVNNGRGLCRRCYTRSYRAGHPATVPPPIDEATRNARAQQAIAERRQARIEDYTELRDWGLSVRDAAARVGVTYGTGLQYEAARRRITERRTADV